jgi:DNA-binding response OmpR family regulator
MGGDPIWSINFVSDDPLRTERVRYHVSRQPEYEVAYTDEPAGREGFDAVVLPAGLVGPDSPSGPEPRWLPVIAYGDSYQLRQAFLAGCFDYLRDPWGPDELLLRLERLFKLSFRPSEWGRLALRGCTLRSSDGDEVELTYQEAAILKHLLSHRGQIVPRDALFYVIWGRVPHQGSRAVDVHISSLRKKITSLLADNERETLITTVRRAGYMISAGPPNS